MKVLICATCKSSYIVNAANNALICGCICPPAVVDLPLLRETQHTCNVCSSTYACNVDHNGDCVDDVNECFAE